VSRNQIRALVIALIGVALIIGGFIEKQRISQGTSDVSGQGELVINLPGSGQPIFQTRNEQADRRSTWMTILIVAGVVLVVVGVLSAVSSNKKRR
jgi:hypothetical protein